MSTAHPTPAPPTCTWSVVSTVREPLVLLATFACHHLALGAKQVHLFLDDPNDPGAEALARIDGVKVTLCDDAHWAGLADRRPRMQTARQTLNANLAKAECDADWLLHVDADEFLWAPDGIAAELQATEAAAATWMHLPNFERVWTPGCGDSLFEGAFRSRLRKRRFDLRAIQRLYGGAAPYLRAGLSGHCSGKAMARTGAEGFISIHTVKDRKWGNDLPRRTAKRACILHFDGMTPRHWALKTLRYAARPGAAKRLLHPARRVAMEDILAAEDPLDEALALHQALFFLPAHRQKMLEAVGGLHSLPFDPGPALQRFAPWISPDLSATSFDALHEEELQRFAQASGLKA